MSTSDDCKVEPTPSDHLAVGGVAVPRAAKEEEEKKRPPPRAGVGRDRGSRGSDSGNGDGGNGDGGNGGNNVAAMAAVAAAPTWRRQWQRGRPMWAEVIFRSTHYYLQLCMTVLHTFVITNVRRMYGKTQKCFDSKYKCVF